MFMYICQFTGKPSHPHKPSICTCAVHVVHVLYIPSLGITHVLCLCSILCMVDTVLRGRDPMAVAVLLEDSAAVSGVFLAAFCLWLAQVTGNTMYDALGSVAIGGS